MTDYNKTSDLKKLIHAATTSAYSFDALATKLIVYTVALTHPEHQQM